MSVKSSFPLFWLLLVTSFLILPCSLAYADEAPLNPAYLKWLAEKKATEAARTEQVASESGLHPTGLRPLPFDTGVMDGKSIVPSNLPERTAGYTVPAATAYDLRDYGYVSLIRNQGNYGTCWAFGTMSSAESSARRQGFTFHDFSEKHLAYYGYTDMDGGYVSYDRLPLAYPDNIYDQGGDLTCGPNLLSRWTGVLKEADAPYTNMGPTYSDTSLPPGIVPPAHGTKVAILTDFILGPKGAEAVGNIKYLLQKYGAVKIGVNMGTSDAEYALYYNPDTAALYSYDASDSNHAVSVVGWNDAYPKENFLTQPSSDGAFIVRNSWGSSWGDNGYFYLSYEDPCLDVQSSLAIKMGLVDANTRMYLYDPLGFVNTAAPDGDLSNQWMANIFRARGADTLNKVSFVVTDVDVTTTVYIYTDVEPDSPCSGTLAYQSEAILMTEPGYHTLELPTSVVLQAGHRFSLVVHFASDAGSRLIPIEEASDITYTSKATATAGQSFTSADGAIWSDVTDSIPNTNVCLRAMAVPGPCGMKFLDPLLLGE